MDVDVRGSSWRWPLLVSVVFLNICLPSLVLSYGVLLVHIVDHGVPIWMGLSTPTLFILTYSLTQCWCREAADSWGGPIGFRVMAALGLVVLVNSLLICVLVPYYWQPYVYGILGGFGSSVISAQVDAVVYDTYDSQLALVRSLCFAGQAFGLCIFPHIITSLIQHYEYTHEFIILSGIMLQSLPAILLLKVDSISKRPVSFSRYSDLAKTYSMYNNELISANNATELQLHDFSKKCWKSPSDDNLHRELNSKDSDTAYTNEATITITPPPSPEEKRRNIFGVEILPEIPEESEDTDDDDYFLNNKGKNKNNKQRLSSAIKRLSTLGDNLDDCISNQFRRDSQSDRDGIESRDFSEVEVTYDNISPVTDVQREKIFNSFSFRCKTAYASMRRTLWMPSYRVYRIRRRALYLMYNVNDTFIKPLTRSLACWRFYPSLALAFAKLCLTAVFLALLPLMAFQMRPKISTTESNFLMTLYAFTWICFLLCTPWLVQTPKRNFKYILLMGLVISTAACFILAEADNHDMFSIGVVISGFGYGAITSCWETTVQVFVGSRKWPKIQSTLETVAGSLLALFFVGISFVVENDNGLEQIMFILGIVLLGITIFWIVLVVVMMCVSKFRAHGLGRNWLL